LRGQSNWLHKAIPNNGRNLPSWQQRALRGISFIS